MKSLYTENLKQQYATLQRNLIVAHFEDVVLPSLCENSTLYWGMGAAGLEVPTNKEEFYNFDRLPDEIEESIQECLEVVFPFYNKDLDPLYMYLEVLGSVTNKVDQQNNPSECDKLKVSEYKLKFM
ncbi:conserved hypothetical protein [Vibrio phage 496E54-1]|nr:conserved hypothetical protein [Vibrio phage 495E54-1]CAH9013911.1 conserved hypothetical protein [Vibrio phage 496E54-1]